MDYTKSLNIIMEDGLLKHEAEKHLSNGTTIYSMEEHDCFIQNMIGGCHDQEEAEQCWRELPTVTYAGEKFKIDYFL